MSSVDQQQIHAQQPVTAFLNYALGYADIGHWRNIGGQSNIARSLITDWLRLVGPEAAA